MKRYDEIDILKGIAIIFMIIFHIFYFPNQYGFKEIEYDTAFLKLLARIAQIIFVICVGINMIFSFKKSQDKKEPISKYLMKNALRCCKLAFGALFITIFTYYLFGSKYVKFGILHFNLISSIILLPFLNYTSIILILFCLVVSLWISK